MNCFYVNKTLRLGNTTSYGAIHKGKRTQSHRAPSINGTYNIFYYYLTLAKEMGKEHTKKRKTTTKQKGKNNEETNDENK